MRHQNRPAPAVLPASSFHAAKNPLGLSLAGIAALHAVSTPPGGPFHRACPQDAMSRLVEWYNYERDHMSLDEGETPAMAYARKMPPKGVTVTDEQSGIMYRRE